MGLFTEQGMERMSFESRLLSAFLTPFDFLPPGKEKVTQEMRRDFLSRMVSQLVARRREMRLPGLAVDDRIGCAEYLTAKWECGMRTPSAFNLMCWAQALGCQWVLVPLPDNQPSKGDGH